MKALPDILRSSASHFAGALAVIGVQIMAVRYSRPDDYGAYVYTFTVYTVIETLITSTLADISTHRLSASVVQGRKEQVQTDIVAQFALEARVLWLSWLVLMLLTAVVWFAGPRVLQPVYWIILALSLPFCTGYSIAKSILVASNNIRLLTTFEIYSSVVMILLSVCCIYEWGIWGVVIANPAYTLLKTASAYVVINRYTAYRFQPGLLRAVWSRIDTQTSRRFATHTVLRNGFYNLANQLDILLIGLVQTPANIAFYKVAKTLASMPSRMILPVWAALRGRIVEAFHKKDHKRLASLVLKPIGWMALGSLLCAGLAWLLLPAVITWLYTADYMPAFLPAIVIMVGYSLFQIAMGWFNIWVVISGKPEYSTGVSILIVAATLLLCGWFGARSTLYFSMAYSIPLGMGFVLALYLFMVQHKQNTQRT